MKREYDLSKGKRGTSSDQGKARITIFIDNAVLTEFRTRAEKAGTGHQTTMKEALKNFLSARTEEPVTKSVLRQVIREEVPKLTRPIPRPNGRGKKRGAA
jgi:hypothetical protein